MPPGDRPTVTALVPALNEARTIPYALASLATQTVPPDRVVVVDDGSTDGTARIVRELSEDLDLNIELRRHDEPAGKTVGVKEVARSTETETLFVLDADTFLESDAYLERLLEPHADPDVASTFGIAYPKDSASKREFYDGRIAKLLPRDSSARAQLREDLETADSRSGPVGYLTSGRPVVQFRYLDYHVQQQFFADGFVRLFGSALFPVGCGVLYDRSKLVTVFDEYEESLGDDLTNSEDIFVGFAFCDRGWRNVQVQGTFMRSTIPDLRGVFKQTYLWGSGFLQSAYYFADLTRRYRTREVVVDGGNEAIPRSQKPDDMGESPSERPGYEATRRPMGLAISARVIDGLYPTTVLVLLVLFSLGFVSLELIGILVAAEFLMFTGLAWLTRIRRANFYRNLVPFIVIRFLLLPVLTYTYARVGADITLGNRDWRK